MKFQSFVLQALAIVAFNNRAGFDGTRYGEFAFCFLVKTVTVLLLRE